ncbi:hypothetical protein [Belnapia moabensis]|uniref:hypothetical protein n=1 Tax=Belnapia moabensis TaxID=365533 RepID=UPI0005B8E6A2|nr:hypothetical protein [Belnapia moabensis]
MMASLSSKGPSLAELRRAGWRVVQVPRLIDTPDGPGLSWGSASFWTAIPPKAARMRPRSFPRRCDAVRWAGVKWGACIEQTAPALRKNAELAENVERLLPRMKPKAKELLDHSPPKWAGTATVPAATLLGTVFMLWEAEWIIKELHSREVGE